MVLLIQQATTLHMQQAEKLSELSDALADLQAELSHVQDQLSTTRQELHIERIKVTLAIPHPWTLITFFPLLHPSQPERDQLLKELESLQQQNAALKGSGLFCLHAPTIVSQ